MKTVEILGVETIPSTSYFEKHILFKAKWSAFGSVGHWGHIHTRKNQYEALITLEPIDKTWKIIDLELLEEKRVDTAPRSKTADSLISDWLTEGSITDFVPPPKK